MPPIPRLSFQRKGLCTPQPCYPLFYRIQTFLSIDRFVKKVYELDPSTTGIPWQPRGYTSKRKNMESYSAETIPKKICTPLIDEEVGETKFLPPGLVVPRQ